MIYLIGLIKIQVPRVAEESSDEEEYDDQVVKMMTDLAQYQIWKDIFPKRYQNFTTKVPDAVFHDFPVDPVVKSSIRTYLKNLREHMKAQGL